MTPDEKATAIVRRAVDEHHPVATFVLFSGGSDSAVLADWTSQAAIPLTGVVYIDTGTALPGVREFAAQFVADLYDSPPFLVYEAGDAYRDLVLRLGGFPGPAGHARAYQRLKERCIRRLVREHKTRRSDRIMLLTGKRKAESSRRYKTTAGIEREGAQLYVNPLMDWSNEDMRAYRERYAIKQSDVAALIHRSGECNCGAFAAPGEREMLQGLWPEWWEATIASLEREAEAAGVKACTWGKRPANVRMPAAAAGPMCSDCQLQLEVEA